MNHIATRTAAPFVKGKRCMICNTVHPPDFAGHVCPAHGDEGILDVLYDYAALAAAVARDDIAVSGVESQWRYAPLLPVPAGAAVPPLRVGWTPLYAAPRLAEGSGAVWVKDETCQPTGSLKDRASAMAVAKAEEADAAIITTASTGNAAAALAGMCASVAKPCVIFVPDAAPPAKIAQLLAFGAHVFLVQGPYDQAFELSQHAAREFGWYNRNTGYNPFMVEGKKTAAYEICEQLGWKAPDYIFVGVGDGCIISGLHKGLRDLLALGWIDSMPRLMGVQSEGSDYFCRVVEQGLDPLHAAPRPTDTVADSIAAAMPRDRLKALAAVEQTGGAWIRVADEAILAAIPHLARNSGVFAEPAGAASLAGLQQALKTGLVRPGATSVIVATGNGLKDIQAASKAATTTGGGLSIPPTLEAVQENLPAALRAT